MTVRRYWRLGLLLILLVCVAGLWLVRQPAAAWPWPQRCEGPTPTWLPDLIVQTKALGYPGLQVAAVDSSGQRSHCVAGWAGPGLGAGPLKLQQRMRYASLSKIFTSALAMQWMTQDRLDPNARLIQLLGLSGPWADERVMDIRITHLLRHTAGFDRNLSPDPMMALQPWCPSHLRALRSIRLDHAPGSRYVYANVGYCLLGAVMTRISGRPLAALVHDGLLAPLGLNSVLPARRGEVRTDEPE